MATLASFELPLPASGAHGIVSALTDEGFAVILPSFSPDHVFEVRHWGGSLPNVGDEVLVIEDDQGEPWALTTGSGGGSSSEAFFLGG